MLFRSEVIEQLSLVFFCVLSCSYSVIKHHNLIYRYLRRDFHYYELILFDFFIRFNLHTYRIFVISISYSSIVKVFRYSSKLEKLLAAIHTTPVWCHKLETNISVFDIFISVRYPGIQGLDLFWCRLHASLFCVI